MNHSTVHQGSRVPFPAFTAQRVYMHEFTKAAGLPPALARWQDTIDAMLDGVHAPRSVFLMLDQAIVPAASTHRRPGLHIDGYWNPGVQAHGGSHPMHEHRPPAKPTFPFPPGSPVPTPYNEPSRLPTAAHIHHKHMHQGSACELLLLASDVLGCAAYVGGYTGDAAEGGACDHIPTDGLIRVDMAPGRVWVGDTMSMLHESLPLAKGGPRTVVRLNVQQ